jgi:hypothetical protein
VCTNRIPGDTVRNDSLLFFLARLGAATKHPALTEAARYQLSALSFQILILKGKKNLFAKRKEVIDIDPILSYFIHNTTCLCPVFSPGGITNGRPIARIIYAGSRSSSISLRKAIMYFAECLKKFLYPAQR